MNKIIEAVVNRVGKTHVATFAVGAMIAGAFIVGVPDHVQTHTGSHGGNCGSKSDPDGYCAYMCGATGHSTSGAHCCSGSCYCYD